MRPGALLGARLTCGSDAIPVLLRPCSLIAPRAAMQHALLERTPYWWMSSGARAARNQAVVQFFRQSAEPCADPPTSPFAALLMDPLAVRAQAHLPPCFSVNGCPFLFLLLESQVLLQYFSKKLISPASQKAVETLFQYVSKKNVGISASNRRQRYRHRTAQDW